LVSDAGSTDCALVGLQEIKSKLEQPQTIFVLGGSTQREKFAAEFASQHPAYPSGFLEVPQKTTPNRYLPKLELTAVA